MSQSAEFFDGFTYGMPRQEVSRRLHITDNKAAAILVAPTPVQFLGETWEETFLFDSDNALRGIILINGKRSQDGYLATQKELIQSGWMPVAVEIDDATFDIFGEGRRDNYDESLNALEEFERKAVGEGRAITVYFLAADFVSEMLNKPAVKFWGDAVDKGPQKLCMLSLISDVNNLKLSFVAPLLARKAALKYGQMIKR